MTDKAPTTREQIEALQAAMKAEQAVAAKDLALLIAGEDVAKLVEELLVIRGRAIPQQHVDQLINQLLQVIGHTGQQAAALVQQLQNPA